MVLSQKEGLVKCATVCVKSEVILTHAIRVRKGCLISILRPTFDQEKKTKFCKQQKIGGFEYFGDSDVVNKLLKESKDSKFDDNFNI